MVSSLEAQFWKQSQVLSLVHKPDVLKVRKAVVRKSGSLSPDAFMLSPSFPKECYSSSRPTPHS